MPTSSSVSGSREDDPLLKDLNEKKQSFKRNVVSLAAELKEAKSRLMSQQKSCAIEALSRQEAEARAKIMEDEICGLQKQLNERNVQIEASDFAAKEYVEDLDDIKSQLVATQATVDASAASAESAESQCRLLLKQLEEKNSTLQQQEERVTKLGEQLESLQRDLQVRESSQQQLRREVSKIEREIMQVVFVYPELWKTLDEVSPKNVERINKLLTGKDDEIARLRDEVKIISAHWRIKTKELEDQAENQRRIHQELKKKVLKLEFCLREARTQARKLQKMDERRDLAIKELREQITNNQQHEAGPVGNQNFWDRSGFKIVVSVSMLVLVMFSRR